jgi:hypothetical protein
MEKPPTEQLLQVQKDLYLGQNLVPESGSMEILGETDIV